MEYEEEWYGDEVYELSVQFENWFLSLMKYDIEKSETKEQLLENERLYLSYKKKNLPVVTDASGNEITEDVFDTASVEKALSDKKSALK